MNPHSQPDLPPAAPTGRSHRHWLILAAILVVALLLRLIWIDRLPPGFHFDESFEGLEAWRILTDPSYRPVFLTGNFGVPPLNAYANALTFALFESFGGEAGPTAMRVTAAFFGLVGVLAVYALAFELLRLDRPHSDRAWVLSFTYPLFAAAVIAIMRWHLHFSRMGIEPILVPLVWAAANWLLLRGWRTQTWFAFAACGALLALGMYAYQGAWVIPFLMAPVILHLLVAEPQVGGTRGLTALRENLRSPRGRGLLIAAAVALLGVLPLLVFFVNNLDLLFLRPTQLAIVGQSGSPADTSIVQSLWATAKMFGPFGAPGDLDPRRNLPGAAALNVWLALPFYLGLIVAAWHVRRPTYSLLLIGLIGLLLPGIFSEYAPHFHRILGASAPAAMLCALGLERVWQSRPKQAAWAHWLAPALLGLGLVVSIQNYFVRWASLPNLFYAFDAGLWESGQWVADRQTGQPGQPIYMTPRGAEHATLAFAWRGLPRELTSATPSQPVTFDGRYIFPFNQGQNVSAEQYMVIEHEDFRTRLLLPEIFPDAIVSLEITDLDGQPYARVYTRPTGTTSARQPAREVEAMLGDGIALAGFETLPESPRSGESLYVRLFFDVDAKPNQNWTLFTHLVDLESGELLAGFDAPAGNGSLTTDRWLPGWRIIDEYEIALPADLPPGDYGLEVGFYLPTGERLPEGGIGLKLGTVRVE
ncbi:MAG: hypothetical protein HC802_01640 [Caldilineaceae bacterium]|nr:hypothetical protein [Caldilineaceae bacterium]